MVLIQNGYSCEYELNIFIRLFFDSDEDSFVMTDLTDENGRLSAYCQINHNGGVYFGEYSFERNGSELSEKSIKGCAVINAFIAAASKIRPVALPWGALSGIRPAKIARKFIENNLDPEDELMRIYRTTPQKAALAARVAKSEGAIISATPENSVGVYIGIPFCPTRCLYCSFVSTDMRTSGKYMDEYCRKLVEEIHETAKILEKLKLTVQSIYIGGGTPTSLDEPNLKLVMTAVSEAFLTPACTEYTLEAGRPDTITLEKLKTALSLGADRISINPQTTKNETLVKIGRQHTPEQFFRAFELAREAGFENINTDLIAGLPDEAPEDFAKSLDDVLSLNPDAVTVHSMCVKRAARLRFTDAELCRSSDMNKMLAYAEKRTAECGYSPYYMYRQKNISGNLENVGYAKAGKESSYNVNIMEEAQTIIALGGGGSSKLIKDGTITRVVNFKDPCEYINRFEEILKKKQEIYNILK